MIANMFSPYFAQAEEKFVGNPGVHTAHRHGKGTSTWKLFWRNSRKVHSPSAREQARIEQRAIANINARVSNPAW